MREAVAQKNQLCVGGKLVAGAGLGHTMHRPRNQARGTPSKGLETQGSSDKSTGWPEAGGWRRRQVVGGSRGRLEAGGWRRQVAGGGGEAGAGGWVAGQTRWLGGRWLEELAGSGWRQVVRQGQLW